jgi:hypothetical protein
MGSVRSEAAPGSRDVFAIYGEGGFEQEVENQLNSQAVRNSKYLSRVSSRMQK